MSVLVHTPLLSTTRNGIETVRMPTRHQPADTRGIRALLLSTEPWKAGKPRAWGEAVLRDLRAIRRDDVAAQNSDPSFRMTAGRRVSTTGGPVELVRRFIRT